MPLSVSVVSSPADEEGRQVDGDGSTGGQEQGKGKRALRRWGGHNKQQRRGSDVGCFGRETEEDAWGWASLSVCSASSSVSLHACVDARAEEGTAAWPQEHE